MGFIKLRAMSEDERFTGEETEVTININAIQSIEDWGTCTVILLTGTQAYYKTTLDYQFVVAEIRKHGGII